MSAGQSLSPNDAMWLNMDTPANLMVIETLMWCRGPLSLRAIRKLYEDRMVTRYPVFTWHPEASSAPLRFDRWVPTPDFDIADHVTSHRLRGADEVASLRRFVSKQMAVPLPRHRPLWHAHVINGREIGAVMLRLHHSIADGAALVEIMMDMTDPAPGSASRPTPGLVRPRDRVAGDAPATGTGQAPGNSLVPIQIPMAIPNPMGLVRGYLHLVGEAAAAVADPVLPVAAALGLAERTMDRVVGTADAVDTLVLSHRPDTVLATPATGTKSAAWCQPLPLPAIKKLARSQDATVNDVLLAGLAGGLRSYCQSRGESPANVITLVPVNMRPPKQPLPPHLGNQFSLVAVELPLAAVSAHGRLAAGKLRMDVIKRGPHALLTYGVSHTVGTIGSVNLALSRRIIDFFSNKAIGVTTNVIGPREPRWLCGNELVGVLGWVPTAAEQSLGVCIFSYNDQVWIGFKADKAAVPNVADLVTAFEAEMAELLAPY